MPSDADVVTLLLIATEGQASSALWPSVAKATSAAGGAVVVQRRWDSTDGCLVGAEFPTAMDATRVALQIVEPAAGTGPRAMLCTRRRPFGDLELGRTAQLLRDAPAGRVVVGASTAVLVDVALPAHVELVPCRLTAPAGPRWRSERLYVLQRVNGDSPRPSYAPQPSGSFRPDLVWARRAAPSALAGRDDATAGLRSAWHAALAGRRRTVVLTGERGIGKTALAADLALAADASGALVLYGRSDHEAGSVDAAIRGAVGTSADDHGFDQLRDRLDRLAADRPVLLVLDDLPRGPRLEQLAGQVSQPTAGAPWMLVVTARSGGVRAGAAGWRVLRPVDNVRDADVDHVPVVGLDAKEVACLIHQRLGRALVPGDAAVDWLTSATAGNPLFVRTILDGIRPSTTLPTARLAMQRRLPECVAAVIRWRLAPLSPGTRRALVGAARRCGDDDAVEVDSIAAALSAAPVAVHAALEPAVQDYLLDADPAGDRYHFRHEIVRQALGDRTIASLIALDGACRPEDR